MDKPSRYFYEFDEFRLDPSERLLLCGDEPVHLQARAFDTLLMLVQNSRHLVQKEDLLKTVWTDSFVEENNLTQNIYALRKALNRANGKNYIETIPRRGYRFTAEVREVFEETGQTLIENRSVLRVKLEEQIEEETAMGYFNFSRKSLAAVLIILFATVGFSVWRMTTGNTKKKAVIVPTEIKTLSVLPFQIENPTNADEYLDLVIADDLSRELRQNDSFKLRFVTPGSKVLENNSDAQTLGRLLKTDAVLTGILRRNGNFYEAETKLLKTDDGTILWSETFESTNGDVYKINDAIAQKFSALPLQTTHRPANLEAYKIYLKARALWNKRTGAELHRSIVLMEQAIAKDPEFALAYAGLADGYAFDLAQRHKAIEMANKALKLNPSLGEAHATLGFVYLFWDWNVAEAERHFKQAAALNPHYATGHQWYAALFAASGMVMAAKEEIQTALELEPVSLPINADAGQIFYFADEHEKAIEHCNAALALDSDFINAYGYLYQIYTAKGMYEEAIAAYFKREEIVNVNLKQIADRNARLKRAFTESGIEGFWREMIVPLKIQSDYFIRAECYARFGNREEAMRLLELSFENREFEFIFIMVNPVFDSYRDDPRFQRFIKPFSLVVQNEK